MIAAHDTRWWFDRLQVGLFERIGPAPEELVERLSRVNILSGRFDGAYAAFAADDLVADVAGAIDGLPMAVLQMLEARLLGVYFCRGLDSSAATDIITTPGGMVIGAVVVLDVDALSATRANQWASWRERSAFAAGADIELNVTLTTPERDDRLHAIQYLLLQATLGADDAVLLYEWLHTSTCCSLCGAVSVFEDFAETFAGFVHVPL